MTPNEPNAPAPGAPLRSRLVTRSPVPYAWVVLTTAMITTLATVPGQTVGVSVFLDPIIDDLGVSRSVVSGLYTLGTLTGALILPFVGRFIDARGPRVAVGVIALAFAVAAAAMSQVASLAGLAIGFVAIRGLGQGSLGLVSLHAVNLWFVRRRGLAVGVTGLGMAIATAFAPALLERLIAAVGWRAGYAALGAGVAAVALPLGVTFFRERPERYGVRPDGDRRPASAAGEDDAAAGGRREAAFTARDATRHPAFWTIAGASMTVAALVTGLVFHHFDLVAQHDVGRRAAAAAFVPLGLAVGASNLLAGAAFDRIAPRFLLAGMLVLQAVALVMAAFLQPSWLLLYGIVIGLTQGTSGSVTGAIYATYFGRAHLGAIKGTATTLTVAGTAIGPLLFAVGRDLAGGYAPVLMASALVPIGFAAASLRLRPPVAPGRSSLDASPGM
ncbi:MAG: MFS transporter [Trueperaceae bacterium]|nr:MFS transporter [Trueperaceae bacterium]